jgi:hypothetical protein
VKDVLLANNSGNDLNFGPTIGISEFILIQKIVNCKSCKPHELFFIFIFFLYFFVLRVTHVIVLLVPT